MNSASEWKVWIAAMAMCAACSDDEGGDGGRTLDSGPQTSLIDAAVTEPPGADSALPAAPERYAVVTQIVASGDQATSYVAVVDSLRAMQPISLDKAQQVLGRALAAAVPGSGVVFVSTGGSPELTRYELKPDDKLERTGTISFQSAGVGAIGEYAAQLQILSSSKAYYFDSRTAKIIVWDPSTLAVTSTIALPELAIADALLTFTSTLPIRQGALLLMPVGWRTSNNQRVVKRAGVIVLDTVANSARVLRDERCGYVRDGVEADDGRIYLATEAWGAAVHRVNPENAPAPCLLRLKADLSGFDESFHVELNALAGATTGSLIETASGKALVRVLDEATANVNAMTSPRALASSSTWSWAELSLGDTPTLTRLPGVPLGTGSVIAIDFGKQRYVAEIKSDRTDIIDISDGAFSVARSTPGLVFSAVQLR